MKRTLLLTATALAFSLAASFSVQAKDSLRLGMQLEPPNLDPTGGAAAAIDEVVYSNVYQGLTRFNADGSVSPQLAESWAISEDGLTYSFKLREGVSFHDGAAFTADDVKFSLDRARAEDSTNAQKALFAGIEDVTVIDDTTVAVRLKNPDGGFITKMAWGDAVILDPASADTAASHPIGTGPFVFSRWARGDRIELERNPNYWGEPVALATATFKFIADPNAAFAAVMSGDLDAFPAFPAPETLIQFQSDPRFVVVEGSTEGETILAMNHGSKALSDVKVRQAIAHAINRQEIIDGAMFGYGTPIGTHFAPHNPDYVDLTAQSNYDPQKAKDLLAEAGYGDGLRLSLKLPPPAYARRGGEIIAAQLRAVGIDTDITNVEWADWIGNVFKAKDYDLTIVSHTEPTDINIYARPDYYFQYDNPDFQALMQTLDIESDPAERSRLYQQAQRVIADDYVNGYLFQLARAGVVAKGLMGLWQNSPTQANDLTQVHWED